MSFSAHRLLIANRGEIAVRILRSAKQHGLYTITVYTPADALSPHVSLADESFPLLSPSNEPLSDSSGYLSIPAIVSICIAQKVTLVHPGYGFLSENEDFAKTITGAGITFLGPSADIINIMGLKHEARLKAIETDVPVVPGSDGLIQEVDDAVKLADETIGWPVMLKSTAGGGGMGLVVCQNQAELREKFVSTRARAEILFKNTGLFLERYLPEARHIEVQVFGNGLGHAVHLGERECSVQRRHQKVIEETPSPFMKKYPGLREKMCSAAVRLCEKIRYGSAGTVEFLVDNNTGEFFFLEMNTRLQVEHPITEAVHPGLDLVELMVRQGIAQRESPLGGLAPDDLVQERFESRHSMHAIEVRVYCENPSAGFKPSPGVLQYVDFASEDWLRVDHWISTGTTVTPFFDPLVAKLIVTASTRDEAITKMVKALTDCRIHGPSNNMPYLKAVCESQVFRGGQATTKFLDHFEFIPRAVDVLSPGIETTIQDFPGRKLGLGIPRSGPMDSLAFRAANILVSNAPGMEALELLTITPLRLLFHVQAVIAVTGAHISLTVDGEFKDMWKPFVAYPRSKVVIGPSKNARQGVGCRAYLAIRGGFPSIPQYLGSKSTSMGLGGYQGRALAAGDQLILGACEPKENEILYGLSESFIPRYPSDWTVYCLTGPHADEEFLTPDGIEEFFATKWKVSASSNRMGIRLEGPKLRWARLDGGEGGSHPSNIHDNGYALGTVNVNGDTPVLLTKEGPDMGGYLCLCTVASGELWKLGQLNANSTIRFSRVNVDQALQYKENCNRWLDAVARIASGYSVHEIRSPLCSNESHRDTVQDPKLHVIAGSSKGRPRVVFRQASDSAILVEYGDLLLDLTSRARLHAFEAAVCQRGVAGIWSFGPCIRSTMCHYDPSIVSQAELLQTLINAELSMPDSMDDFEFSGRRITFPIVLDDKWSREALERYTRSIRNKAAYLPSNIEYLARNNGLDSGEQALRLLIESDWLVFGAGFYLACPFLVPIDPRCRLVGQKMNPSRTYTPRGAIGIAGLVAAIYPIESPGGYQLFGRTLPAWQTWGRSADFTRTKPWLLEPFDHVKFEPVTEEEYTKIEKQFDAGQYKFKIEPAVFSIAHYLKFVESVSSEIARFKERQAIGVASETSRENTLLEEWEMEKKQASLHTSNDNVEAEATGEAITSSLAASVWKIKCQPGDIIQSPEQVVIVLEAMKTEINVEAGEENVGRKVKGLGKGVKEGAVVQAGDVMIVLE